MAISHYFNMRQSNNKLTIYKSVYWCLNNTSSEKTTIKTFSELKLNSHIIHGNKLLKI